MTLSHKGRWFSGPFASCTYTHNGLLMDSPPAWWKLTRTISQPSPLKNFIITSSFYLTHTTISSEIQQTTPSYFSQTAFPGSNFHFIRNILMRRIDCCHQNLRNCCPKTKKNYSLACVWNENTYSLSECTLVPPNIFGSWLSKANLEFGPRYECLPSFSSVF